MVEGNPGVEAIEDGGRWHMAPPMYYPAISHICSHSSLDAVAELGFETVAIDLP